MVGQSNISEFLYGVDPRPLNRILNKMFKKKEKKMATNELLKTEDKNVPKYFYVKSVHDYGMRETFEEALAEAQHDAMDGTTQYVMKAIKLIKAPDAAIFTRMEDIH